MNIRKSLGRRVCGILAAGLVGLLTIPQGLHAAGRNTGAKVSVVTNQDAVSFMGEVVGVRADAIVIETGQGEVRTVAIKDISRLRLYRKSAWPLGATVGALVASGVAYAVSSARYKDEFMGGIGIAAYTIGGAAFGALGGGLTAGLSSADKTYDLTQMSPPAVKSLMAKLQKKARVPKYQ